MSSQMLKLLKWRFSKVNKTDPWPGNGCTICDGRGGYGFIIRTQGGSTWIFGNFDIDTHHPPDWYPYQSGFCFQKLTPTPKRLLQTHTNFKSLRKNEHPPPKTRIKIEIYIIKKIFGMWEYEYIHFRCLFFMSLTCTHTLDQCEVYISPQNSEWVISRFEPSPPWSQGRDGTTWPHIFHAKVILINIYIYAINRINRLNLRATSFFYHIFSI